MNKTILRASLLGLLLVGLAALPAAAQIPPGPDYWVTPDNGRTFFTFPNGDVESLCGAPPSTTWNHRVNLKGVPVAADYDTVVQRLDNAVFNTTGNAQTRIVVKALSFASAAPQGTPCGTLTWKVGLAGTQSLTVMRLRRTSPQGGFFSADIAVNVEFKAYNASSVYVGSLFYSMILPDPQNGTPWSFGPTGLFRAGMTTTNNCVDVLREKLSTYTPDSDHAYFISNMIAQGLCYRTN